MKRFIITITLLVAFIGSAFAVDLVRYGSFKNDKVGAYSVYFDYDATEPFELEKESIKYFFWLQKNYKKVEAYLFSGELAQKENWWCLKGAKHKFYRTLEIYEDYIIEDHVNKDGTITQYIYYKNNEEK